jgi:hypothetical protein
MADVIKQGTLVELMTCKDVRRICQASALDSQQLLGEVEIHQSGVWYQLSLGSQKIGMMNLDPLWYQLTGIQSNVFDGSQWH